MATNTPTDLRRILEGLGIATNGIPQGHTSTVTPLRGTRVPTMPLRPPTGRTATYRAPIAPPLPPLDVPEPVLAPGSSLDVTSLRPWGTPPPVSWGADVTHDDGWGAIGDVFHKALEVIDVPRSYATSAVKELTDLGQSVGDKLGVGWQTPEGEGSDFSWDEFTGQAKRHMGFQEILDKNLNMAGGWQRSALGFMGDLLTDPLLYTGLAGSGRAATGTGSRAVEMAVNTGGRNEIAKAVSEAATAAGRSGPEIDKLIAGAARRGQGGITPRALARAGVDDATRQILGIPTLERAFAGARIPGTGKVANAVADIKGAAKEALGMKAANSIFKFAAHQDEQGARRLMNVIRGATGDPKTRADAVRALASINTAKMQARKWGAAKLREAGKTWGKPFRHMNDNEARDLTALLDVGAAGVPPTTGLAGDLRKALDDIHEELTTVHGVELGHVDNYVPHVTTEEARLAARGDQELRAYFEQLQNVEGFERHRGIVPGTVFLGETVKDGTIRELNDISQRVKGIKMFEDDSRILFGRYLDMAQDAIYKQAQRQELARLGVATEMPQVERIRANTPDEVKQIKAAEKALDDHRASEVLHLDSGAQVRRDQAGFAAEQIKARQREIAARVDEIDQNVKDLARDRVAAESRLARAESQLPVLQQNVKMWDAKVRAARGPARREAEAKARQAAKALQTTQDEIAAATENVRRIMQDTRVPLGVRSSASKGFKAEAERLRRLRDDLTREGDRLAAEAKDLQLKVNPPGMGPLPVDQELRTRQVNESSKRLEEIPRLQGEADTAKSVFDFAVSERNTVIERLNRQEAAISKALDDATKLPHGARRTTLRGKRDYAFQLRERLQTIRDVLSREGMDPQVEAMAKFEASALEHDMAAFAAGDMGADMGDLIKHLQSKEFRSYIDRQVSDGFAKINSTHQIPEWLNDAITIQQRFRDPLFAPGATKFLRKFENLWKGYAIARPGFVVRNAYSSAFNVYLEAGATGFESIRKFHKFYKMYKTDPENYMAKAISKWGEDTATRLDQALGVVPATGGGQSTEFASGVLHGVNANPLSSDFAPIRGIRAASEDVEAWIRGGHALNVLERGGSVDLAVDTVNKWHFNYRDITDFDRQAKHVNPFWMFFSRNMMLQSQVWTKFPQKLNQTYFNVQRNANYGDVPDQYVPNYFNAAEAIRMTDPDRDGDVRYLFPDIPSIKFMDDVSKVTEPSRFIGDLAPLVKMPVELAAGKQFFSGAPFQDSYELSASKGGGPRVVPPWLDIPGIELLPGFDRTDSGEHVWTDRSQYVTQGLVPTLGTADRLSGPTRTNSDQMDALLSFLGISTRRNTDATRASEQKRREFALRAEAERRRQLEGD